MDTQQDTYCGVVLLKALEKGHPPLHELRLWYAEIMKVVTKLHNMQEKTLKIKNKQGS